MWPKSGKTRAITSPLYTTLVHSDRQLHFFKWSSTYEIRSSVCCCLCFSCWVNFSVFVDLVYK